MKLKPLPGFVLIEPLDEEQKTTSGGLVLPEKTQEKPMKGKVIQVGEGKIIKWFNVPLNDEPQSIREEINIKKGSIVVFHRWSGQDVQEGDKEYKLVKFSDLMGVYE